MASKFEKVEEKKNEQNPNIFQRGSRLELTCGVVVVGGAGGRTDSFSPPVRIQSCLWLLVQAQVNLNLKQPHLEQKRNPTEESELPCSS